MDHRFYSFLAIVINGILFISCEKTEEKYLSIAVSSNAQFVVKALVEEFEITEDVNIEIISSSSGKLAAQILQGAPYDIFISADRYYPDFIYGKYANCLPPKNYAKGSLILWSTVLSEKISLEQLKSESIENIAIANPQLAPYGKATVEFLQAINQYETLKSKLVIGENISQTALFIQSGAVQAGFTARSLMYGSSFKNESNYLEIDTSLHSPIVQAFIVLKPDTISNRFANFILSNDGRKILSEFGYFRP
ncbi:molybdate ABC transporter substrate-binding protein [Hyphobacterium sp. CCMP332]|nr:molybdate ABC transporter substrate-binding protein [Hyphobacterium sp. CCMP332]